MTDLATLRTSLEQCYDAVQSLTTRMSSEQWRGQSLCPDWNMRDVVTHLGMMERVMTGWLPTSVEDLPPLDRARPYLEQAAGLDDKAFASQLAEIFDERRADLAGLTAEDPLRPSWTPIGPKTYGGFLEIRIFDFWVHERDITTPLGWPTDDTGSARRDLPRPGRRLDRLHRRQENRPARRRQHRVPPDRPHQPRHSSHNRRPRQASRPRSQSRPWNSRPTQSRSSS